MTKKRYKLADDVNIISVGKIISYIGILGLICIISFLIAKYIVNIGIDEKPIDTSQRI